MKWKTGIEIANKIDPDEKPTSICDGAPAHHSPADPGQNTKLNKLPPYSLFLNIVEQSTGISALKAAIKADISCPQVQQQLNHLEEARRHGIALGHHRTQLLL